MNRACKECIFGRDENDEPDGMCRRYPVMTRYSAAKWCGEFIEKNANQDKPVLRISRGRALNG